jgi:hypothetical protein
MATRNAFGDLALDETVLLVRDAINAGLLGGIHGRRTDTDGATVADGIAHPLQTNARGQLKTASVPGLLASTSGTFVSGGNPIAVDVSQASYVVFGVVTGVAFAGHNVTFEGSIDGGTTWNSVQAVRTVANVVESTSGALSAVPGYIWRASVLGYTNFRLRLTAATSGTSAWRIQPAAFSAEPTIAVSQTGTWSITGSVIPGTSSNNLGKAEDAAHASGDTGVAVWGVRNDNAASAPTSANGDYSYQAVDSRGVSYVTDAPVSTPGTPVAFALTANTATTLLAANAARKGAIISNNSGQTVYLRYGAAAAANLYTLALYDGERYEVPFQITASISAISTTAGSAVAAGVGLYVTEFTA